MEVIGLDIGHSAVKIAAGEHRMFPTAATLAVELSTAEDAAAAKGDRVTVNGKDYFVGRTAEIQTNGQLLDGLRDEWIESDEHLALLMSGYRRGIAMLGTDDVMLVLGLPSRLHNRQQKRLAELAVMHTKLDPEHVRVIPQPLGAYMSAVLDEDGTPLPARSPHDERWGIIDVGYYTADYGLIESGVWSQAGAKSSGGASVIATDLQARIQTAHGVMLPLRDCDTVLRTKSAKLYGKVVDLEALVDETAAAYAKGVIENAHHAFGPRLPTLDGIIIAGGAAELIHGHVKGEWAHAITAKEPRFTVAEGMRRYGLMKQLAA